MYVIFDRPCNSKDMSVFRGRVACSVVACRILGPIPEAWYINSGIRSRPSPEDFENLLTKIFFIIMFTTNVFLLLGLNVETDILLIIQYRITTSKYESIAREGCRRVPSGSRPIISDGDCGYG